MNDIQPYARPPRRSTITLVPGNVVYDTLLQKDPQKLQRLIRNEQRMYQQTHAPEWEATYNARAAQAEALINQVYQKGPSAKLLGLDTCTEPLTKRIVTNAYRRAARKAHPDAGGDDEAFKHLHAAYRRILAATPRD